MKDLVIDFISGTNEYRRKFGGGRSQAIAKAVGVKRGKIPSVVDATAGLGRDAFVLASLGCRVHMMERHPELYALLSDALNRAKDDDEVGEWVSERLTLSHEDSINGLSSLPFTPDVIYLDPMFPEKKGSALVKKEMQILQEEIGSDDDADQLLAIALGVATNRVVVKRPAHAPHLADREPDTIIKTKKNRFDIYLA